MKPKLPPLLRPLLALLTVLASFAFQLRVDALGGLRAERTVSVTQLEAMLEQSAHCGEAQAQTQTQHAHHAPRQPVPHSPDEHAGHGAHCPFCLTNAFALEAGIVGLPQGPPHHLPTSDKSAEFCVLDAPSHADARAPPLERA